MVDAYCNYGEDIVVDQYGGIQSAEGWDETQQQISRDLYTCPVGVDIFGTYLQPDNEFEPLYGLGLPRITSKLGTSALITDLQTKCEQAVLQNANVDKNKPPIISFNLVQHALNVLIQVFLTNNQEGQITFEVTP